jgi:hypothetical protein
LGGNAGAGPLELVTNFAGAGRLVTVSRFGVVVGAGAGPLVTKSLFFLSTCKYEVVDSISEEITVV